MKAQCNGVLGSTLGTSFTTSGNVKVKYVQSTNSVEMTYGTTPLSTCALGWTPSGLEASVWINVPSTAFKDLLMGVL